MPVIDWRNPQTPSSSPGWGLNPFTDIQKGASGIGSWIDQHIPGPNLGIGSAVGTIAGAVPGIANIGLKLGQAAFGNKNAADELAQVPGALGKGLADTATDVTTLGGLAPWTNQVEQMQQDTYGYRPSSLRDYTTKPGRGLLGGALNDVANIAMFAGPAAKLASAGEVGEAAQGALAADRAAQLQTVTAGGTAADAQAAGQAARVAAVADGSIPADAALARAKLIERIGAFRQGVDTAFNPYGLGRAAVRPFTRAALSATAPADELAAAVAPAEAGIAPGGTQGPQAASELALVGAPKTALQQALDEAVAHAESPEQKAVQAAAAEQSRSDLWKGHEGETPVTLYQGGPESSSWWTPNKDRAAGYGEVREITVPKSVADDMLQDAKGAAARGEGQPTPTDHFIDPQNPASAQWATVARNTEVPVTPVQGEVTASQRQSIMGPLEKRAYLAQTSAIPEVSKTMVSRLPQAMVEAMAKVEGHWQRADIAKMIRENERMVGASAARARLSEPFQEAGKMSADLVGKADAIGEKIRPNKASEIIGERIAAAMTHGPEWEALEARRGEIERAAPGAVERMMNFRHTLPEELNTPEFRAAIQSIAKKMEPQRADVLEQLQASERLGNKGLENATGTQAQMTGSQQAQLRTALQARLDAETLLEKRAPKEQAAAQTAIEGHRAAYESASAEATAARGTRAAATQQIIENRYGPRISETGGEIQPGEIANGNLTEKQMVGTGTGRSEETATEAYRRARAAEQALNNYQAAKATEQAAVQRMIQAQDHITDLETQLTNSALPSQLQAAALHGKSEALLQKLSDGLASASERQAPAVWGPLISTGRKMAEEVHDYPELETILADLPKTFGEAVKFAQERGFDPVHISDMTPTQVRNLAFGTSKLGAAGKDIGEQFASGVRKIRTGALRNADLVDRSLDSLVAGISAATHEERTNHIVDYLDRAVAQPVSNDGVIPRNWVAWDPIRRGMLTTEKANETVAVQARYMIPRPVANLLRDYGRDYSNPMQRTLARITNPWRALVLTMSPKFYLNHFVGHVVLATTSGATHLSDWTQAFAVARKNEFGTRFADLPEITGQSIVRGELGGSGMVGWNSVKEAYQTGGLRDAMAEVSGKLHDAVNTADSFARAATYFSQLRKGADMQTALQYAAHALVDYGNLSNFERQVVRSVVPFYSFERGVMRIVTQYPMDHPVAANVLMQIGNLQTTEWSKDSNGNPLPAAYQDVVDFPGLGKVNLKTLSPFKDVVSLTTPEGIVSSMQFAVQALVRSGLGVASPGTKPGLKIGPTGHLVPDVSLSTELANTLTNTPQGSLLAGLGGTSTKSPGQAAENFLGIPTVTDATLNKAGAANVLAQGSLVLPAAEQQKAQQGPVNQAMLDRFLSQASPGTGATPAVTPAQQQAAQAAVTAQQQKSAATRRASAKGGGGSHRVRTSGSHRTGSRSARGGHMSGVKGMKSRAVRLKLSQGFGKATNAARSGGSGKPIVKSSIRGVPGMKHRGR